MRRLGKTSNIIEEICEYSNIYNSLHVVMRGRKRKKSRVGRWIMAHQDEVIKRLQEQIRTGTFCLSGYREMLVTDGPKVRRVQSVSLIERIGCNAIMAVVEDKIFRRYIRTTAASIKRRGMHDLLNFIRRDLQEHPEEMKYAYKFDIKKFYESVNQDFMMYALRRMFKDKVLLTMLERFVRMMPNGLSIGLRSSQGFGNMLLSMFLDHYIKDQKGYKHFYRYCDDGDGHSSTKKECWKFRDMVHERAGLMMLQVKGNERVFPVTEGIDFLGYVIYPTHTRLRKRNKQNAARKLHKVKSKKRRQEIIASLYGQCKHANCHNLFYRLTGIKMEEYVRLKDTGIQPKYKDGKKRFHGNEVNLADLVDEEFVIKDFETDLVPGILRKEYEKQVAKRQQELDTYTANKVTPPVGFVLPNNIPLPPGKYLMSIIRNPGTPQAVLAKVWTGDKDNWSKLDQIKEQELLGKVLSTVRPMRCKGFTRYILE